MKNTTENNACLRGHEEIMYETTRQPHDGVGRVFQLHGAPDPCNFLNGDEIGSRRPNQTMEDDSCEPRHSSQG